MSVVGAGFTGTSFGLPKQSVIVTYSVFNGACGTGLANEVLEVPKYISELHGTLDLAENVLLSAVDGLPHAGFIFDQKNEYYINVSKDNSHPKDHTQPKDPDSKDPLVRTI